MLFLLNHDVKKVALHFAKKINAKRDIIEYSRYEHHSIIQKKKYT